MGDKMVICLGIESTAHTLGIGIVNDKGKILADKKITYVTDKGGMIPHDVAEFHKKYKEKVLEDALKKAGLNWKDIDLISFSQGPGLSPSLVIGKNFAIELSEKYKKNLVGVNHLVAHLEIGKLFCKVKDPVFVFVSGANTQIIAYEGEKYRIFGETLDIGLGNALDKFGRVIGLGFPCGPKIEELARKGKYIELPYTVKGMDLAFSGIVTKAIELSKKNKREDLCFSLQETCFAMLTEVTERAMAHCEKDEALLIGGVAANKRLIEMLDIMCKERRAKFYAVPLEYSGDNGVMIAWQGILERNKKQKDHDIKPGWRTDEVEVNWI